MTSWKAGDSAYLSDARYSNFLFDLKRATQAQSASRVQIQQASFARASDQGEEPPWQGERGQHMYNTHSSGMYTLIVGVGLDSLTTIMRLKSLATILQLAFATTTVVHIASYFLSTRLHRGDRGKEHSESRCRHALGVSIQDRKETAQ
eukprot:1536479-Pleurochrysis_carterae.AAC.12